MKDKMTFYNGAPCPVCNLDSVNIVSATSNTAYLKCNNMGCGFKTAVKPLSDIVYTFNSFCNDRIRKIDENVIRKQSIAAFAHKKRHMMVLTALLSGFEVTIQDITYAVFKPGQQFPQYTSSELYVVEPPHYCLAMRIAPNGIFEGWMITQDMPLTEMCSLIDGMSADELINVAMGFETKTKLAIERKANDKI